MSRALAPLHCGLAGGLGRRRATAATRGRHVQRLADALDHGELLGRGLEPPHALVIQQATNQRYQTVAIARELAISVRNNVTIDWTVRENVRANLRVIVKRILRKYGYPPDKQERATQTVLEQAEVLSEGWVALDAT